MAFDSETLSSIYASTQGFCHRCRHKLAFSRFGAQDARGAWDIDATSPHPKVTALLPSCLRCLQQTSPRPTPMSAPVPAGADERTAREPDPPGERAEPDEPVSEDSPAEPRAGDDPALQKALIAGAFGALLGGLWGALLGGLVGLGVHFWG